jgi:hypothetical protein
LLLGASVYKLLFCRVKHIFDVCWEVLSSGGKTLLEVTWSRLREETKLKVVHNMSLKATSSPDINIELLGPQV